MTEILATRAAQRLDLFAGVAFDFVAEQDGRAERWARVRRPTRALWRESVGRAATAAAASQFSTLAREPLPNPPDPFGVMALHLSIELDAGRSRATTRAGKRRARSNDGGRLRILWPAAIHRGLAALQSTTGEPVRMEPSALLVRLPDLRAGADLLHGAAA